MKNRRIALLFTALTLLVTLLAGCGGAPSPSAETKGSTASEGQKAGETGSTQTTYPITIKDGAGRDVTIKEEPKRIVSVVPSNTELMFALGKGSSLVGRSDFCDYPVEAKQIESIGGFFPPNYEKIVSLDPDLILLTSGSDEARAKLENEYKLTTFVMDPQNFTQLYAGIKDLGQAVNAQEQAAKLVADMEQQVKEISDQAVKASSKPVVFYQVWDEPLQTAGPNSFIDDMIRMAGGTNAAVGVKERWAQFSVEQLAAADPEIIITGNADAAKAALQRKGWESLKAVKEGKVVGVPDENLVVRPGPRLVQGLKWFAEQIHPEIFTK